MGCVANRTARWVQLDRGGKTKCTRRTADLLDVRCAKLAALDTPELRRRHPGSRRGHRQADAGGPSTITKLAPNAMRKSPRVRGSDICASLHRRHGA
jgi:hypothetical protein